MIRKYCLSFPGAVEQIQWIDHLLFKVGGKMFLMYNLSKEHPNRIALKCAPEKFDEIVEIENIIPAPYLARNKWISILDGCKIKTKELKDLINESYEMVFAKLPKKLRTQIRK